ncbi:glycosyltransferase family 2 protein, partial [Salmonella enterica subsp. enterica]|nr:glycosyltransferase family 2 protein [Salmonella enterica subsp. enterica]
TVSIIMPAYNAEKTIRNSILSILKQSYSNFRLYVINDSSTDLTENIVKSINDERIVYLVNDCGKGVSSARNVGIAASCGKFIAFCDSDDIWFEKKLEEQLKYLNDGYAVVCSNYEVININNNNLTERKMAKLITYKNMLHSNCIGNLTGIYNASIIGKVYQKDIGHEDYLMWLTIVKKTNLVYCVQKNLARYTVSETGLSSNKAIAALWQWNIYRNELGFSMFKSLTLFIIYAFKAFSKRFYSN